MAEQERHTCGAFAISSGYFDRGRCGKTAKYEEGGNWYCGVHAPSLVKAKQEKRDAAWRERYNRDNAARGRRNAVERAKERVIAAATAWRATIDRPPPDGFGFGDLDLRFALIRKIDDLLALEQAGERTTGAVGGEHDAGAGTTHQHAADRRLDATARRWRTDRIPL